MRRDRSSNAASRCGRVTLSRCARADGESARSVGQPQVLRMTLAKNLAKNTAVMKRPGTCLPRAKAPLPVSRRVMKYV